MRPATLLSMALAVSAMFIAGRSHRRRANVHARVAESDAHSRGIIRNLAEGVVTTEADGAIVEANPAAERMFGFGSGDLVGRNLADLVPEHHCEVFEPGPADPGDRGDSFREMKARRRDGSEFLISASFSELRLGARRHFTGLIRDVTARRSVRKQLRESEAQLRAIADAMPGLIAYVDAQRIFRFHNKPYEEFFGKSQEDITGHTMLEVLGPEVYGRIVAHVDEVLAGYPVQYERSQKSPTGEVRDLAGHFFPRYGEGTDEGRVVGFYSLVTDITNLKRVDRMKSEFISTVSHELRTPLTSIRGSLGLILGGVTGELTPAARNLVEIAANNCERLIRIINDLLDTEKIESGKMHFDIKVVELGPIVRQAVAANEGFASQHKVSLRIGRIDAGFVRVDPDRVTQVLTNLLSNAVKFSPSGDAVEVDVLCGDGRVRVEIRDRGPGIAEEFRSRIFGKFSQADSSDGRAKGGTGLGLNISKVMIERMGGKIGFETELGVGTTFYFELAEVADIAAPPATTPAVERRTASDWILVCEDDADIARLITMMLEGAGFRAETVGDARAARQRLASGLPFAMTLDIGLSGEDGISLLRGLRAEERTRNLPVVIVSAAAEEGRIKLNEESLTVSEWLRKPIDENRLIAAIRGAVGRSDVGRPWVLHVEDDPDVRSVSATIARDFANFEFAASLAEARMQLRQRPFDLVIVDLGLPDGSGSSLIAEVQRMRPQPRVIVFSASDRESSSSLGVDAVLVKSRTTNEDLLGTIRKVVEREPPRRRMGDRRHAV